MNQILVVSGAAKKVEGILINSSEYVANSYNKSVNKKEVSWKLYQWNKASIHLSDLGRCFLIRKSEEKVTGNLTLFAEYVEYQIALII